MSWPRAGAWPGGVPAGGPFADVPAEDRPVAQTFPLVWHRADRYALAASGPNAGKVENFPALYANTPSPHRFDRTNDVGPAAPAASPNFNGQLVATFTTSVPRFMSNAGPNFWDFYFGPTGWSHLTVCGPTTPQIDPGNVSLVCGIQPVATGNRWQITMGNLGTFPWRAEVFANGMGSTVFNLGANLPARFLLTICDPSKPAASRVTSRLNNLASIVSSWTQPGVSVAGSVMYLCGGPASLDGYRWVGPWAEGIWWGRPLGAADVTTLRDYLNARYLAGLTWS